MGLGSMTVQQQCWLMLLSGLVIGLICDLRRSYVNSEFLKVIGSQSHCRRLSVVFYLLIFVFAPLAWQEAAIDQEAIFLMEDSTGLVPNMVWGFLMVISGVALRLWASTTLGRAWTLVPMNVPGGLWAETGPYRYFGHPDYLGRLIEGVGLFVFLGSYMAAGVYILGAMAILVRIVVWEEKHRASLDIQHIQHIQRESVGGESVEVYGLASRVVMK